MKLSRVGSGQPYPTPPDPARPDSRGLARPVKTPDMFPVFPCVAICVVDLSCQLLVSAWDRSTSVDVLGHWLSVLHVHNEGGGRGTGCEGGWLPREQILGEEARKRVPAEFMAQVRVGVFRVQVRRQPCCKCSRPRRSRPRYTSRIC